MDDNIISTTNQHPNLAQFVENCRRHTETIKTLLSSQLLPYLSCEYAGVYRRQSNANKYWIFRFVPLYGAKQYTNKICCFSFITLNHCTIGPIRLPVLLSTFGILNRETIVTDLRATRCTCVYLHVIIFAYGREFCSLKYLIFETSIL